MSKNPVFTIFSSKHMKIIQFSRLVIFAVSLRIVVSVEIVIVFFLGANGLVYGRFAVLVFLVVVGH